MAPPLLVLPAPVLGPRQWPEVYDLCHTSHAKRVRFSHVRVFSDSRNVQKCATKSDTLGHCLLGPCTAPLQTVFAPRPAVQDPARKLLLLP